jgi:hypothetical protein
MRSITLAEAEVGRSYTVAIDTRRVGGAHLEVFRGTYGGVRTGGAVPLAEFGQDACIRLVPVEAVEYLDEPLDQDEIDNRITNANAAMEQAFDSLRIVLRGAPVGYEYMPNVEAAAGALDAALNALAIVI